jgi:hypothetical protein
MTHDDLVLNDRQLLDVFDVARREGALVMEVRATWRRVSAVLRPQP